MSKRFVATFFLVLASILIVCFIYVLLLFLLPGVSMFGLKYIGLGTHHKTTGKVILSEQLNSEGDKVGVFSGIILNNYEVPVNVIFSEDYTYYFEYEDNYNGITNSKITDPELSFSKDEMGNIVIDVNEYHTFLYETATSTRYINIYIPIQTVGQTDKYALNLTINSNKSPVTFKMETSGYLTPATFNNLTINSNGKINYEYNVEAVNYSYKTSSSIEIDEEKDVTIKATNYELNSTDGKIVVKTPVSGDLTCTTKLGRVLLISCRNLTATTSFGDVGYAGSDDGSVTVSGVVNITTRAGNVTLGNVNGQSRTNSITTSSGNITINIIFDGAISTQRGQVNINSVRDFEVTSTTGKITIQEVKQEITARSTRGKITLGGENMLVSNVDVYSTLGKVTVTSATGNVNIETISADVEFTNTDSKNIAINCGGKLSATDLRGNVNVYVGEAIEYMSFTSVKEGNTEIVLGSECREAYVYISATELSEVSYYVQGSTIEIQEYRNAEWQQTGGNHQDVYQSNTSLSPYSFTIDSDNAVIVLRFTLSTY